MPQQERMPGTARVKRNCWMRGNESYSYRRELKRGIALSMTVLKCKKKAFKFCRFLDVL